MDVPLRVQDARTLAESVFHVFGLERGLQRAHAAARSRARAMRSSVGARRVAALEPSHRFEPLQIGRASRRERVCQYVYISVVAVSLKQKQPTTTSATT